MPTRRDLLKLIAAAGAGSAFPSRPGWGEEARAMLTRKIPKSGEALPVIGLGTSNVFDVASSDAALGPIEEVVRAFVDGGARVIDSSPMYGRAERVTGDVVGKLGVRDRLFLATKVWTKGREEGLRQMEASIAAMRAGTMDLIQVHNLVDVKTQLATLRAWKEAGRLRYVGITHYRVDAFDDLETLLREESLDFVQLNYSIGVRDADKRLLPLAADRGVAVLINRPFEDGALFDQVKGKPVPAWGTELGCASWAQVFLKFVVSHPAVTCAIPATAKVAHMRDNLVAGTGPMPDPAQRVRMSQAWDAA